MLHILFWLILGAAIGAIAFLLQRDKWKSYPFYAVALFAIGAVRAMEWSNTWWIMVFAVPAALLLSAIIISQLVNLFRKLVSKRKS